MIPQFNYGLIYFNCALVLVAGWAAMANLVVLVLQIRKRVRPRVAIGIAAPSMFIYALMAMSMFWAGAYSPMFGVFFSAPVATGLVVVILAARSAPSNATRALAAAAIALVLAESVMWWMRDRRAAYSQAVLEEDAPAVRTLVHSLPVRTLPVDDRSLPLVRAATAVNIDIVRMIVESGPVNMNVDLRGRTPLLDAIHSTPNTIPTYYRIPLDDVTHRQRQMTTIAYLIDHGADPSLRSDGVTPAEEAFFEGREDILALLKQKGAKDADSVPAAWGALLQACAEGNVEMVNKLTNSPLGRHQIDSQKREPLVVAAAHGHLDVVEALLRVYGGSVKCDMVARAAKAAEEVQRPDIVARLSSVCPHWSR